MLQGTSHRPIIHVTVSVSVRNCVQELVLHRLAANLVLLQESWPCWSLQTSSWNTLAYQWVPASREQEWTMDIHGPYLMGSKSATIVFQHFHLMPTPQRWKWNYRRGANRTHNRLLALEDIAISRKQPKNLIFDVLVKLNSWIYHRSNTLLSARLVPVCSLCSTSVTQHMCAWIESGQSLSCLFIAAPFFTSSFNGSLRSFALRKPRKWSNKADTETPGNLYQNERDCCSKAHVGWRGTWPNFISADPYLQSAQACFFSSISGCSFATTIPNIWSYKGSQCFIHWSHSQEFHPNCARDRSSSPAILQAWWQSSAKSPGLFVSDGCFSTHSSGQRPVSANGKR